jgi:hypothetical protein
MSKSSIALATGLVLALAACGGSERGGSEETAPPPTTQKQESTAVTTTQARAEPEPITDAEKRWLRQVEAYSRRIDRDAARTGIVTHAAMRRSARLYTQCRPMLREAGDAGRFEPARLKVESACERLRKAARLLGQAIASTSPGGSVIAETPDEEQFQRVFGGALEATGNAQYDLQRALERAEAIERSLES